MPDHEYANVTDPTDWLRTRLEGLASVEAALRCQVCKDFYKTPMMTTCAHTFCSLCIRRALASDGKCPLCRTSDQELKLRSNMVLEEAVDAFVSSRAVVLEVARSTIQESRQSPKRKLDPALSEDAGHTQSPQRKKLRSSARLSRAREGQKTSESVQELDFVEEDDVRDVDYEEDPEDGLTPCPICGRRMKEWQVFSHLDKCTGEPSPVKAPAQRPAGPKPSIPGTRPQLQMHLQPNSLERLPALNYSMLKDQALRKKMSELGISTSGSRQLLEKRHREWVTIWNANCDAAKPKKQSELLRDLDLWERTQGGRAPALTRSTLNTVTVRDKEFDGAAWAAKHDSSFKELIAHARRSRHHEKQGDDQGAQPGKSKDEEANPSVEQGHGSSHSNVANLGSSETLPIHVVDDHPVTETNGDSMHVANPAQPTVDSTAANDLCPRPEPAPISTYSSACKDNFP